MSPQQDSYPSPDWGHISPGKANLSEEKLQALAERVEGRGCVVRHGQMVFEWGDASQSGDLASASKPVLSTLLLFAIQEGKLRGPDARLVEVEPRLAQLNGGKDAEITWRHLASQTSGYGLSEAPGAAYSYNDFALALYFQTLMERVFQEDATQVLRERLAAPLGFQDAYTYDTFPNDRPGRLSLSPRDFARFGLLYLHEGRWLDRQLLRRDLALMAISSPIPADTPLTGRVYADMLPGQRSMGGTRHITTQGPGYYSFNWWLNWSPDAKTSQYPALPADAYLASGHGSQKALWVIPSWGMIAAWSTPAIAMVDNGTDPKVVQAAEILRDAVLDM